LYHGNYDDIPGIAQKKKDAELALISKNSIFFNLGFTNMN